MNAIAISDLDARNILLALEVTADKMDGSVMGQIAKETLTRTRQTVRSQLPADFKEA